MVKKSQQRMVLGLILIGIGLLIWFVPSTSRIRVITVVVGIYLGYLWLAERRVEGRPSPWLLGVGLALIVDAVDVFFWIRCVVHPAGACDRWGSLRVDPRRSRVGEIPSAASFRIVSIE